MFEFMCLHSRTNFAFIYLSFFQYSVNCNYFLLMCSYTKKHNKRYSAYFDISLVVLAHFYLYTHMYPVSFYILSRHIRIYGGSLIYSNNNLCLIISSSYNRIAIIYSYTPRKLKIIKFQNISTTNCHLVHFYLQL